MLLPGTPSHNSVPVGTQSTAANPCFPFWRREGNRISERADMSFMHDMINNVEEHNRKIYRNSPKNNLSITNHLQNQQFLYE